MNIILLFHSKARLVAHLPPCYSETARHHTSLIFGQWTAPHPPCFQNPHWWNIMEGPLVFRTWIMVGMESCLNRHVAEWMRTWAGVDECVKAVTNTEQFSKTRWWGWLLNLNHVAPQQGPQRKTTHGTMKQQPSSLALFSIVSQSCNRY